MGAKVTFPLMDVYFSAGVLLLSLAQRMGISFMFTLHRCFSIILDEHRTALAAF